jgi:hypothetical protein
MTVADRLAEEGLNRGTDSNRYQSILRATIHPRTASLPLLSAGMAPELPIVVESIEETPTVLACASCEVTWRDRPGAPCWFCGEAGHVANPERLVLD